MGPYQQMLVRRAVGAVRPGPAEINRGVGAVTISTVDGCAGGQGSSRGAIWVSDGRPQARDGVVASRTAARTRDVVPRDRRSEFQPLVLGVGDGVVRLPPGHPAIDAVAGRVLRLVGAVCMTFKAHLVFIGGGP